MPQSDMLDDFVQWTASEMGIVLSDSMHQSIALRNLVSSASISHAWSHVFKHVKQRRNVEHIRQNLAVKDKSYCPMAEEANEKTLLHLEVKRLDRQLSELYTSLIKRLEDASKLTNSCRRHKEAIFDEMFTKPVAVAAFYNRMIMTSLSGSASSFASTVDSMTEDIDQISKSASNEIMDNVLNNALLLRFPLCQQRGGEFRRLVATVTSHDIAPLISAISRSLHSVAEQTDLAKLPRRSSNRSDANDKAPSLAVARAEQYVTDFARLSFKADAYRSHLDNLALLHATMGMDNAKLKSQVVPLRLELSQEIENHDVPFGQRALRIKNKYFWSSLASELDVENVNMSSVSDYSTLMANAKMLASKSRMEAAKCVTRNTDSVVSLNSECRSTVAALRQLVSDLDRSHALAMRPISAKLTLTLSKNMPNAAIARLASSCRSFLADRTMFNIMHKAAASDVRLRPTLLSKWSDIIRLCRQKECLELADTFCRLNVEQIRAHFHHTTDIWSRLSDRHAYETDRLVAQIERALNHRQLACQEALDVSDAISVWSARPAQHAVEDDESFAVSKCNSDMTLGQISAEYRSALVQWQSQLVNRT